MTVNRKGAALVGLLAGAAVFACNVFASLERCASDADCPSGRCDPSGKFCLATETPETGTPDADLDVADTAVDADAYVKRCYAEDPFTSFEQVKGLESVPMISARLVAENSVLFSALNGCNDQSCYDIFVAVRDGLDKPFGTPAVFPRINCSTAEEYWPTLASNGLLVFFESSRKEGPAGTCGYERPRIWSSFRPTQLDQAWSDPHLDPRFDLPLVIDSAPYLHPNNLSLYFVSFGRGPERDAGGGQDIYVSVTDPQGLLSTIKPVDEVNSPDEENFPVISLDDKTLYFARNEPDSGVGHDVFVAHRDDPKQRFGAPKIVAGLDGASDDLPAWISDDACRLYFTSNRPHTPPADDGGLDAFRLWVATRRPR